MKTFVPSCILVLSLTAFSTLQAAVAFMEPPGGWDYIFDGDQDTPGAAGSGFSSLDGSWSHDNGSDEWDGSQIGGTFGPINTPGGVMTVDGYLRIQDTGDPRDHTYADPGSNRKQYFGHDIGVDGATATIMDEGVTLVFRIRLATDGPLDMLHPDGGGAITAWPSLGDGYLIHDSGKGPIGIKQSNGGVISFALATADDTGGLATGLLMNNLNGSTISGDVDSGEAGSANFITLDPTQWHEFWVNIVGDTSGGGTHRVTIYKDGEVVSTVFHVTAGSGNDFGATGYIGMGQGSTGQSGAFDVDFYGFKAGVVVPPGSEMNRPPQIENLSPANGFLFHPAASGLSFTATTLSPNSIATQDIQVLLNDVDITASLVIGGTATSRSVQYSGLTADTFYTGQINVTDNEARTTQLAITFDTLSSSTLVIEAEDYNYGIDGGGNPVEGLCGPNDPSPGAASGGGFQDNAPPSGFTFPGLMQVNGSGVGYLDLTAVAGTDFSDTTAVSGGPALNNYRTCDPVGVQRTSDVLRQKYVDLALDQWDLQVYNIQAGEWLNYTRTLNGNFRAYLRVSSSASQQLTLSQVTSAATQPGQSTQILGVFDTSNSGASHQYVPLTDGLSDDPVVLGLSSQTTLRITALSANNNLRLNFLVLIPTTDSPTFLGPIVTARSPSPDATAVRPNASISLTISNRLGTLDTTTVQLHLDGVNVTSSATVTPAAFGGTVSYLPPASFAAGSSHTVRVSYGDNSAPKKFTTNEWSFTVVSFIAAHANLRYMEPLGGWYYTYTGDAAAGSPRRVVPIVPALDGTWNHENGSDEWNGDGLTPGDGTPGGIASAGGVLSIVDPGDPRGDGVADPSNRKIYFGHDMAQDGVDGASILDSGVTISFRARLTPASAELATPDGYVIGDGGKGHFGVKQSTGGIVSFSLTTSTDSADLATGLIMNNLNGAAVSGDVDTGEAGTANFVTLDPTEWHEFWISIVGDTSGGGTHRVTLYQDGGVSPTEFHVTAGNGSDYAGINYLALGEGSTAQSGAVDIDFFSYLPGVIVPQEMEFILLVSPRRVGDDFSFGVQTEIGSNYTVQYKNALSAAWIDDGVIAGDGSIQTITRAVVGDMRYYQVVKQ